MRYFFCYFSLLITSAFAIGEESRPNVLIFFIDDLGFTDIGVNGSTFFETPNIDGLAKGGANFKRSYSASPVCSPTRAALMTGKAPQRVGITQWIAGSRNKLALSEITLGESFQEAGYRTGYVGKWHLGKGDAFQPKQQGFEYTVAVNRAGQPASFFYPFGKRSATSVPDLKDYQKGDYLTDALTDEAIEFINRKSGQPFFLCLSHYAVHTPIQAPKDLVEKYRQKQKAIFGDKEPEMIEEKYNTLRTPYQNDPTYAAMIENLDSNIGRVVEQLEANGQRENTIVLFTSDNGGLAHRKRTIAPTSNQPLRSGKGWTYEGGIRIPTIISWPGTIQPQVSEAPIITMDMFPTLLELCNIKPKADQQFDGKSLQALLNEGDQPADIKRVLAWTYPHVHGSGHKPSDAILEDNWKLIRFAGDEPDELYFLTDDLGEQKNLASEHPEKVTALKQTLDQWLKETQPVKQEPKLGDLASPEELYTNRKQAFENPKTDDPKLPNVLIIGDSISIGYTPFVRNGLEKRADVYRIKGNGKYSGFGVEKLDEWLSMNSQWDVIHFNWGLWDLCYRNPKSKAQGHRDKENGNLTTTTQQYQKNLEAIVARLKKTGAKLIWCATTPVPEGEVGRHHGDAINYNKVAAEVMQKNDIVINDLHSHALKKLPEIMVKKGDVHFTQAGSKHLAEKVIREISAQIE